MRFSVVLSKNLWFKCGCAFLFTILCQAKLSNPSNNTLFYVAYDSFLLSYLPFLFFCQFLCCQVLISPQNLLKKINSTLFLCHFTWIFRRLIYWIIKSNFSFIFLWVCSRLNFTLNSLTNSIKNYSIFVSNWEMNLLLIYANFKINEY